MISWIVLGWLAASGSAQATEPDEENVVIVSLSVDRSACNLRRARRVELLRLARDYADLRGECVSARGWRVGRALFSSRAEAESASPYNIAARRAVGIYGRDGVLYPLPRRARPVAVAGLVGGCEFLPYGSAGYCHSVLEGGFLIIGEMRPQR